MGHVHLFMICSGLLMEKKTPKKTTPKPHTLCIMFVVTLKTRVTDTSLVQTLATVFKYWTQSSRNLRSRDNYLLACHLNQKATQFTNKFKQKLAKCVGTAPQQACNTKQANTDPYRTTPQCRRKQDTDDNSQTKWTQCSNGITKLLRVRVRVRVRDSNGITKLLRKPWDDHRDRKQPSNYSMSSEATDILHVTYSSAVCFQHATMHCMYSQSTTI